LATSTSAVVNVRCYLDSTFNWLTISVFGEFEHIVHYEIQRLTTCYLGFELLLIIGLGLIPTYAADANYGKRAGFYLIMTMNMFVSHLTVRKGNPNRAYIFL
jgi:hypothetical protein